VLINVKRGFLIIIFVFISIYFSSCQIRYTLEEEPNNDIHSSAPIYNEKLLKGIIIGRDDIDFYRITMKETVKNDLLADIEIKENKNLDLILKIYRGNRIVKVVDDDIQNNNGDERAERMVNVLFSKEALINGAAIFSVEPEVEHTSFDSFEKLDYTISIKLKEAKEDEEKEPNDKAVFANSVGESGIIKGYFNPASNPLNNENAEKIEEDWYSFAVNGKSMKIIDTSLSAVPNIDSILSIYDDLGYLIRESNSYGIGEPEKIVNVGVKKGKYYIRVKSSKCCVQNPYIGYLLKIEKNNWDSNYEYEPNDRYSSANNPRFSEDFKGYINPKGDIDWLKFNIYSTDRQVVTVKISPTAYMDPALELLNMANELILKVDDRKIDEGEIIKNIGVEEGVYYIKISDKAKESNFTSNPYTILINKREWSSDEEFEPNNDFDSANEITVGEIKRAYITPGLDEDFYWFSMKENATINFEVTPIILLDMVLRIYNQDRLFIGEIDENGLDEEERGSFILLEGNYFLEIFSKNKNENSRDSYILKIFE